MNWCFRIDWNRHIYGTGRHIYFTVW